MSVSVSFQELMEFSEWERGKWHQWLCDRGNAVLGAGPHGDGRFESVGDLVKHMFIAKSLTWIAFPIVPHCLLAAFCDFVAGEPSSEHSCPPNLPARTPLLQ